MNARNRAAMLLGTLTPARIITAAILLRIVFALAWGVFLDPQGQDVPLRGATYDSAGADGYVQIAHTLLETGEYAFEPGGPPVHNRPPVPPLLLAIFGAWSTGAWWVVWFFGSALLHLVMLLALLGLARDHGFSERRTRVLLLLGAFHPYLVFIHKTTTFINPALAILTLTVWLFLRIRTSWLRYSVFTGLSCGAGALTHGTFLLMPLVFAVILLFRKSLPPGHRVYAGIVIALITALIVAPWTYRNYRTFHMVIPVVTGNGYHYWKGDAQYFGGAYRMASIYRARTGDSLRVRYYGAVNPRADSVLWKAAVADMQNRPWVIPARIAVGYLAFFAPWDAGKAKAVVSGLLNFPLLLFLVVFLVRAKREHRLTYTHLSLLFLALYIVTAFAFFLSYGSYFTMLLPTLLFLVVSLAPPATGGQSGTAVISPAS